MTLGRPFHELESAHKFRRQPAARFHLGPGQTGSSREEIAAMWRFTRNNGITEGFHNKMELINRQAFASGDQHVAAH